MNTVSKAKDGINVLWRVKYEFSGSYWEVGATITSSFVVSGYV
jgi:hypothetical protein